MTSPFSEKALLASSDWRRGGTRGAPLYKEKSLSLVVIAWTVVKLINFFASGTPKAPLPV